MEIEEKLKSQVFKETPETFSKKVIDLVWEDDIGYWDAILNLMDKLNLEEDTVAKLLTPDLKVELELELKSRGALKKSKTEDYSFFT